MVEDFSVEGIQRKGAKCQEFLNRGESMEASTIGLDRVYMDLFLAEVRTCVEGMKYKGYLFPPINKLEGYHIEYPKLVSKKKYTKLNSLQDYENLLKRIQKIPKMLDDIVKLLKLGMEEGITYAKESLGDVDAYFSRLQ